MKKDMEMELDVTRTACDLRFPGWNKGTNIKRFLESNKINPNKVIYMGDSNSDTEGMIVVKYAACPANATIKVKECVKGKSGFISKLSGINGAIDIFENYLKNLKLKIVITDIDGVIYEGGITKKQEIESFRKNYVEKCKGHESEKPPITFCTGRSYNDSKYIIKNYGFTSKHIPTKYHNIWPKLLIENGTIQYNPITKEITNLMGNKNEKLLIRIEKRIKPQLIKLEKELKEKIEMERKITMISIIIPNKFRGTNKADIFAKKVKEILKKIYKIEGIMLKIN